MSLTFKARTMLNYNLSSRGSEGQHLSGLFFFIKNSYYYSGLNYINGMQNLDIINIFSCIRLIVYTAGTGQLHNKTRPQRNTL